MKSLTGWFKNGGGLSRSQDVCGSLNPVELPTNNKVGAKKHRF